MNVWTRKETIIAFNVYCKIPFRECNKSHPIIKHYASLLGRTPSALTMKIGNIGRLDPDLQKRGIRGLVHGAKMEENIWHEFYGNPERLAYESEKIIAELQGRTIEENINLEFDKLPEGEEREVTVRQRVNQSFFRMAVLSSYNNRCCISGVGNPELLDACHIVDWVDDKANRTNPKNGLCMTPFFHRAYDKMLMAISPDLIIYISDELLFNIVNDKFAHYLKSINGDKITMPDRFFPEKDLLQVHYEKFLKR